MADVGTLYGGGRARITELVRDLEDRQLQTTVPACPGWTVKQVVSHLSGVCADIIGGRLEGVATDPWTAAQVDARRDWPIQKVIEEWAEFGSQCEAICDQFGGAEVQWMSDLITHEHDVRGALGRPGDRNSESLKVAFEWLAGRFGETLSARNVPPLRFVTAEGDEVVAGEGEPAATVKGSRFDLFRALTGRRSHGQLLALDWEGDAAAYAQAFEWGPFTPASAPLEE
jgi:uncharacterized protein (TIGR03083 family)